jgi:hypothetical protein
MWEKPACLNACSLRLESQNLGIGVNMHRILGRLIPSTADTKRYVWIDSICINQSDRSEKEMQIPLMTTIYKSATRVVAFPGDGDKADMALDFVGKLADHIRKRMLPTIFPQLDRSNHFHFRDQSDSWRSFMSLLGREFWTRVWIIQELVMAESVTVFNGGKEIPFDLLGAVAMAFKTLEDGTHATMLTVHDWVDLMKPFKRGVDFVGRFHDFRGALPYQ